MRFRVLCYFTDVWAVDAATAHAALVAWQWARPWRERIKECVKPVEKKAMQQEYRAERDRLIAGGELAFTRPQLLRQALRAHIDAMGWRQREWKSVPAGEDVGPGRRWGTGHQNFTTSLLVDCDDVEGELVRRVAYWQSEAATRELVKWTDRWGRGPAAARDLPEAVQGLAMIATMLNPPRAKDMRERDKLRAQIVTTGDIMRQIIRRAGDGYSPPRDHEYRAWLEAGTPATIGTSKDKGAPTDQSV